MFRRKREERKVQINVEEARSLFLSVLKRRRVTRESAPADKGRRGDMYKPTEACRAQEARREFPGKHSEIVERVYPPFRKRDFARPRAPPPSRRRRNSCSRPTGAARRDVEFTPASQFSIPRQILDACL